MRPSLHLRQEVDQFNAMYPIGTMVRYWRGVREGDGRLGQTTSEAFLLGGHTPVVLIDGCSGSVALSHVEPEKRNPS